MHALSIIESYKVRRNCGETLLNYLLINLGTKTAYITTFCLRVYFSNY